MYRRLKIITGLLLVLAVLGSQGRAVGQAPVISRGNPLEDLQEKLAALEVRVAALEQGQGEHGATRTVLTRAFDALGDGDLRVTYPSPPGYEDHVFTDYYIRISAPGVSPDDPPLVQVTYIPGLFPIDPFEVPSSTVVASDYIANFGAFAFIGQDEILIKYKRHYVAPWGELTWRGIAPEADGTARVTLTLIQ